MKLFPKEIIGYTTQHFIPKNTVRSKWIYTLMLIVIGCALGSMPLISVPIHTSARGIIKSKTERVAISSIHSGKIKQLQLQSGQKVLKGDTLLVLETLGLDDQLALTTLKIQKLKFEIGDLEVLVKDRNLDFNSLKTALFQKEYVRYVAIVLEHQTKLKKLKEDLDRNELLLRKGVVAKVHYEESKLDYDLARNAFYQFKKQTIHSWQAQLTERYDLLTELENRLEQGLSSKTDYVILAPIEGWVLQQEGLQVGGTVQATKVLAEITPDDELIAESYVSPRDIALIDSQKEVKLQIDAFHYNHWGFAYGRISEISNDVEFIDNQPLYRVRSVLKDDSLYLPNGHSGKLQKGMTFNARFKLAERTVYQLLYDKMDDWRNPGNASSIAQNN